MEASSSTALSRSTASLVLGRKLDSIPFSAYLKGLDLAHAMSDMELPPEVSLMPGKIRYRAGDHQLMSDIHIGQMHPPEGDPDNLFTIASTVTGEEAAGSAESTGCKMSFPT
jgi:branched-chain amino acid transport system substrate-binding protein